MNSSKGDQCGSMPAAGDRSQRYEVRYMDRASGEVKVFGWTPHADGGELLTSAKLWPQAKQAFVIDRQTGQESNRGSSVVVQPETRSPELLSSVSDLATAIREQIDLHRCEDGDPCSYDHTCRIHKIRGLLKRQASSKI